MTAQFWMASGRLGEQRYGTVEVVRVGPTDSPDPTYLVFCSDSDAGGELECRIGFSNDPARCDLMTGWGFVFIEGRIDLSSEGVLEVRSAAFPYAETGQATARELDYEYSVLTLPGVSFAQSAEPKVDLERAYRQSLQTLDPVLPASCIRQSSQQWKFKRQGWRRELAKGEVTLSLATMRWPPTMALPPIEAEEVWWGDITLPSPSRPVRREPIGASHQERLDRPEQYGPPVSLFRAIEVLGVRLDIPREDELTEGKGAAERQERKLFNLISPLNFHLSRSAREDQGRPDFFYRPATDGITIELLRYGRMSIGKAFGDLTTDDFESQHELLVRLVVGRIDEDSAQAQEVATFVPALFVDNSWSKFLGRQFMGLDKRLAYFCTGEPSESVPLSPRDAADPEAVGGSRPKPPPLASISHIRLAHRVLPELHDSLTEAAAGAIDAARARIARAAEAALVFEIDCDPGLVDDWDRFELAPTDAVLRSSPIAARRWRQDDFEDAEVRRDFARAAGSGSTGSFYGVQASPVGNAHVVDAWRDAMTWISGRYAMAGSAMLARPRGLVSVTLHRIDRDGFEGWNRVCDLLNVPTGGKDADGRDLPTFRKFTFGPGSWYRLRYDMDLSLVDGLD